MFFLAIAIAMAMAMSVAMATAVAVIRPEHAYRGRPPRFFMKNVILDLFWSFLGLLDLKNGSGSNFYARKWYRDLLKPKFKAFHDNSMILWHPYMD